MTPPTIYPPARVRLVRSTSGAMVEPTRGLIPHVQVGRNSLFGYFDNPANGVSSHLWLSEAGDFEQYVPFNRQAWAQKAGNRFWISVECAGFASEDYTPIQLTRLAELYAWGMREFGWVAAVTDDPNGRGIGTHRMGGAAWGAHECPGPIRAGRRPEILRAAIAVNQLHAYAKEDDMPLTPQDCEAVAETVLARLWERMTARPPGAAADWYPPRQSDAGALLRRTYETTGDAIARLARIEAGLKAAAPAAAHAMSSPPAPLGLDDLLDAVTQLDAVDAIRLAHAASAQAVSLVPSTTTPAT